jgi:hypothetical protein
VPLFAPIFFGYSALMLGSGVTAVLAAYNALALRRFGLAFVNLALGLCGLLVSMVALFGVLALGVENPHLVVLTGRLVQIGFGALIAWTQWRHVGGHDFLDGKTIPLLGSLLAAFGLVLLLPSDLYILLLFPVLALGS